MGMAQILPGVAYRNDRDPVLFDEAANILRPEIRGRRRSKCQGARICGASTAIRISHFDGSRAGEDRPLCLSISLLYFQ